MLERKQMWQAVENRDAAMDGRFVYAVRSTRVYCRPGCPSRRPDPAGVEFFATCGEAEGAGYRACRRCRPNLPPDDLTARIRRWIETHEEARLKDLAAEFGLSEFHLQRRFKRETGMTPKEYRAALKANALRDGLRNGAGVTAAIYDAGFGSSSRVYGETSRLLGMTPARYSRGGAGQRIRYTVAQTSLGPALIARTDTGVCSVVFEGDEVALRREFPGAALVRDDGGLSRETDALCALAAGGAGADLPLDLRGTAFQLKVWRHLRTIPPGRTESYADVACAVGNPRAVRAVANACAANPAALVVPCHRVVRTDGGLGGYRWGVRRKQTLLHREGERASGAVTAPAPV